MCLWSFRSVASEIEDMALQLVLLYISAALALATLVCVRWKRRKLYAAAATMDGPPCLPLLGHVYLIFGKRCGGVCYRISKAKRHIMAMVVSVYMYVRVNVYCACLANLRVLRVFDSAMVIQPGQNVFVC